MEQEQNDVTEIILEMIGQYYNGNKNHFDFFLRIACYAWNIALLPPKEAKEMLKELLDMYDHDDIIYELLEEFVTYKNQFYPEEKRFILEHKYEEIDGELFVSIDTVTKDKLELSE